MRLIDADALIEFCAERWIPLNIDAVNMQPTIQPEKAQLSQEGTTKDATSDTIQPEPQEGEWVDGRCSKCGGHAPFWAMASTYYASDFCPHCGARMKGE